MKIQSRLKGAAAPIALSIALLSQPAFAQDDTDEATAAEAEDEDAGAAIIVTGSRIKRDEFSSAAPITVIDPDIAVKSGQIDTAAMIQGSPIASGSSQVTSALSVNYVTNGGTGTETISLRGLGAERTLVLLNGRRAGPSGTRGAVSSFDLNVLPQSIVQRVDILKDGASSIYGSDAVAGVVNLITKTDTDGIELDVFGSAPFSSGGETFSASATWGTTFDGGHILVSGNYYRRNELARGDRDYLGCEENYVFTDLSYETRADLVDPRTGKAYCGGDESNITWGHVWTYDYMKYLEPVLGAPLVGSGTPNIPGSAGEGDVFLFQYDYDGTLAQYLQPIPAAQYAGQINVPAGWFIVANDPLSESLQNNYHPGMDRDSVIPQTDRYTAYVDAAYQLAPSVEVYGEFIFSKRKNYVNGSAQPYIFTPGATFDFWLDDDEDGIVDPSEEVYIPVNPQAAGWTGAALFSPTGYAEYNDSSVEVDYYRGVLGFRGDITSNWSYDIYGQWSRSEGTYRDQQTLSDSLDMASAPCQPGDVTAIEEKACVDVDWYSGRVMYGDYTAAEAAFLFDWEEGKTRYDQKYVEAIVTGDLLELPAGTVGIALGVNYREDEILDTPGHITLSGNAFQALSAKVTAGKTVTKEAFGEINIPILSGSAPFESLDFTGAARVTNVRAIRSDGETDDRNGNWTYKLGLDWKVTDWLRFRGTYGTSYRAPALFEQFLADQKGGLSQRTVDPCIQWGSVQNTLPQYVKDNCAADGVPSNHSGAGSSVNIYTGGGFGVLQPETSKAWTASAVLTPNFSFLPDTQISLAVDYFNIEVNGEIAQLGAPSILAQCYFSDNFPNDPVCDLFARMTDIDPSHPDYIQGNPNNVAFVRDSFINVNSQENSGVDVTLRAVHDFAGDTTLTFQGQMTWQTNDTVLLISNGEIDPESDNGEAGDPKWVGDFSLSLDTGPWSFFYNVDVIGATDDSADWLENNDSLCPTYVTLGNVCLKLNTEATFYHSFSISREFGENLRVTAGVTNLFNTTPPRVSSIGGNGIQNFGKGVLYSQYDLLGIRGFMNVNVKF